MKRIIVFLLLCLGLTGCALSPEPKASMEAPSLPVPAAPDTGLQWDLGSRTPTGSESETAWAPDIWESVPSPGPSADVELDADVVIIHQEANPTAIENEPRWEDFLAAVELGEECEVRLRMVYGAGEWDLHLRYDGKVFNLTDEDRVTSYRYLLIDREDEPPAGSSFRQATHYLLSDDPNMTWERYMARMVSSYVLPGDEFPATMSLFTMYE